MAPAPRERERERPPNLHTFAVLGFRCRLGNKMGPAAGLEPDRLNNETKPTSSSSSSGMTKKKGEKASQKEAPTGRRRKQNLPNGEEHAQSCKMPKRAAPCKDFKDKSDHITYESDLIDKQEGTDCARRRSCCMLTCGKDPDNEKPSRRLTQFILHSEDGTARPLEMVEAGLFITGTILPLCESSEKD